MKIKEYLYRYRIDRGDVRYDKFLLRAMSKYRASSNRRSRSAKLSGIRRREFLMKFRMCLNMPPSLSMK